MVPTIVISARGEQRLRSGHPWIYRADMADVRADAGDVVVVRGPRARTIGHAFYSDRSQIALRMLAYGDRDVDAAMLIRERIAAAIAFRESLQIDATAYRLVHGEADLLPALIIDRYGDYLVVQALSQGMDRRLPEIVSVLDELVHPRGILGRNDPRTRSLEGLDARVGNVFDELRGLERLGERFDTIVLDPPAFAKNKASIANAHAGYKEINLRALKLLNPGGTLVTCSCSYNINEAAFAQIVYEATVDAQVHVTVMEKRMQGRDHPVLLGVPETYYLKCFILRRLA